MPNQYINAPDLKVVRVFDGHRYQLITHTIRKLKRQAVASANSFRKSGMMIRVVPVHDGYALYTRIRQK